jgi:hypothetical protein
MASQAQAWPRWLGGRARAADKNRDGHVGPVERKAASKVNTPWEARADKDHDGRVESREAARAASVVNRGWEARADTNNDGRVSPAELRLYRKGLLDANHDGIIDALERRTYWAGWKIVAAAPYDAKYDLNKDGYLSGDEIILMLKDLYAIVKTNGRAIVNTPLEREFDANNDGVIDAAEAPALLDAIGA